MTNQWLEYKLGDVVNFISGGTPSKKKIENWGGSFPWISCKDMKSNYLYDSQDHLTSLGASKGTKIIPANTILIVVRGMVLAKEFPVALSKKKMAFNQDLKAIQCIRSDIDYTFLFWWFRGKSDEILGIADEAAHGTKRLQTDRLQNLKLCLPPLPTQRKIAGILSAYDDLIENNIRRIEILEEMARMLYREWFVKFRFPVDDGEKGGNSGGDRFPNNRPSHNHPKLIESELGLIPEGWEVVTLKDITDHISRGVSPKYDEYAPNRVINQRCIRDFHLNLNLTRRQSRKVKPEKMVRFGDVLINSTGVGTLGRLTQVYQKLDNFSCDSHVSIVRPSKELNIDYFGYLLFEMKSYFENSGVGATGQTELSRDSIKNASVVLAPKELQEKFSEKIQVIRKQCFVLSQKNINLRKTRDLLLPRLISGEIDVEDLDINIGDGD